MNEEKLVSVPVGPKGVELRDLDSMFRFATCYLQSGLAPTSFKNAQQLVIAWAKAAELGLSPLQAVEGMSIINNLVGIMGDLALAMVQSSGLLEDIKVEYNGNGDNQSCTVTLTRKGRKPAAHTFSVAQAKRAGLWGRPGPWTQYPDRMLRYRALGFGLRDEFADVLKGTKTVEELRDYPEDNEPVEIDEEAKIAENQRFSAQAAASPPPGVKIVAQTGTRPTPAEAAEPAFPETKLPGFAAKLQEDFLPQEAKAAPPLAPERKTDPYQKEAPDELDMSSPNPEPEVQDLTWKEHIIRSVDHAKFKNKKVADLSQRELSILESQWLPLVREEWDNATSDQQADALAFEAAIAFSKNAKPW